jgi:hypothetical protein
MTFTNEVFPEAFVKVCQYAFLTLKPTDARTCSPTTDISAALEKNMLRD